MEAQVNQHEHRREQVLAQAVAAGKFPESRREAYRQAYDNDPAGTERLIASLASGLTPAQASALFGRPDPEPELSIAATLFPELRRPQSFRHGGSPGATMAATVPAEPVQTVQAVPAEQQRPAPLAPGERLLDQALVDQWSRQLFPDAIRTDKPKLITFADD